MPRAKGTKNKPKLLTLEDRIKVLAKIVGDKSEKTSDRIMAVKTITDMLSDKVQKSEQIDGYSETVLKFDNKPENTQKQQIKEEKITQTITNTTTETITANITQDVKQEEVKKDNSKLTFNFIIDNNEQSSDN